jgi:hypothetical protein
MCSGLVSEEATYKAMGRPIVVTIPHHLGKAEAIRRLKVGFANLHSSFAGKFMVLKDVWHGDHLDFESHLLGQMTKGTVDVGKDQVRLEVELPWILSLLAEKAKALVEREGQLMLEKPVKPIKS